MKAKTLIKRTALSLSAFLLLVVAFTLYVNMTVVHAAKKRIYTEMDSIPYNKVALLLGTNPLNRWGQPNSYFTNRINTAAELYHAGKVDFIIASGDNHIKEYDEPTAMRDSLMAHGVPEDRIILDFAGFRTLDSVVRAKEVFGCDSITIISQEDHNSRALYLAEANGINAIAISASLRAGRWVRTRLALRELLARDKMMLDIWFGMQPHFLGEKIMIPEVLRQKSYSTVNGMTMLIVEPKIVKAGIDSLIIEFRNTRKDEGMTGEWFRIDKKAPDGHWQELPYYRKEALCVVFNAIGWIVRHDTPFQMTVKPWFYKCDWTPGTYRVAKTFSYPPYPRTEPSDTAFVEFQIK